MTRRAPAVFLITALAAAATAVGLTRYYQSERAALVQEFAAERLELLRQAARRVESSFGDIREHLRFAGELVQDATVSDGRARVLKALLTGVEQYRAVRLFSPEGAVLLTVVDPRGGATFNVDRFAEAMAETARRAHAQPHMVEASTALASGPGVWFRAFALALPASATGPPAVLALLVESEIAFFRDVEPVAGAGETRLLLIGDRGRHPATHPSFDRLLADHQAGRPLPLAFKMMMERMRAPRIGTLEVPPAQAAQVGLPEEAMVAAFVPIRMPQAGRWSLAAVTSLAPLRTRELALRLQLWLYTAVVLAALTAAGTYVVVELRRGTLLRERLHKAQQLAHLHEKTDKILDHIPVGVMVLDRDHKVSSLNRALRERVPEGAVGQALAAAFPRAPAAVVERLGALVDEARGSAQVRSLHGERLALYGQEGQYSVYAIPLEPLLPEAQVLLVIEDLSELLSLTTQLLRAEKLATVGVLAAGIAHEIGTPLSVIRGRAEYIAGKLGDPHPQAEGMRVILSQIDYVTRTLRQLLDFARVQPAAPRPVAVGPVVEAVRDLFRFETERRKVTIEAEVAPGPLLVAAEADPLQQVLVNLVINACDACAPGGRVRLSAEPGPPGTVRLVVADDGCGIPQENLNQVFDPFFTTKKRGQGTGLGLTIAAQIMRNHGGRIEITSEPGQGTQVVVTWPAAPETTPEHGVDAHILVADDHVEMGRLLCDQLRDTGYTVSVAAGGEEALRLANQSLPDLALTDLRMERVDGLDVLNGLRVLDPGMPVLIMTAFGAIDTAVEAIKRGAYHYLTKPFPLDELLVFIERALADRRLRDEHQALQRIAGERAGLGAMIGRSAPMLALYDLVERLAQTPVPVLIRGESGAGKELVARALHFAGPRRDRPFVAVNCTALPEALLESELFGHVRGAFTGATIARRGLFVEADGGTLFLDEIGDMVPGLQAELLRTLETGEVRAVGADGPRQVDVRIVAATHQDLEARVREGTFRQDLYYRLNVVPVEVPPLRARAEDVPLLIERFIERTRERSPGCRVQRFSPELVARLAGMQWPGNVRELENVVTRLVVISPKEVVDVADLASAPGLAMEPGPLAEAKQRLVPLRQLENEYIAWVVAQCGGNKTRAAEILKIDVSTIHRRDR